MIQIKGVFNDFFQSVFHHKTWRQEGSGMTYLKY